MMVIQHGHLQMVHHLQKLTGTELLHQQMLLIGHMFILILLHRLIYLRVIKDSHLKLRAQELLKFSLNFKLVMNIGTTMNIILLKQIIPHLVSGKQLLLTLLDRLPMTKQEL